MAAAEGAHSWCEAKNAAAVYESVGTPSLDGATVSLTLADYTVQEATVVFGLGSALSSATCARLASAPEDCHPPPRGSICSTAAPLLCPPDYRVSFHVMSSTFVGTPAAGEPVEIGRLDHVTGQIDWNDAAPWGAAPWTRHAPVAGHSLSAPPSEDSALLAALGAAPDFARAPFRDFSPAEIEAAREAAHVTGPNAAPRDDEPQALFLVSASAGGKTTALRSLAGKIEPSRERAVVIDGAIFRETYAPYARLLANGRANGGIWYSAWTAAKFQFRRAKKLLLQAALENRQSIIASNTASDVDQLVETIEQLKADGYRVNVVGVYADPNEIMARGVARELVEGKRYNRDVEKLRHTFQCFGPPMRAANGQYMLVRNAQGNPPSISLQGAAPGGGPLPGVLARALEVLTVPDIEPADVSAQDFHYVMEGNLNIVCSYCGQRTEWQGRVLRMRKDDNASVVAGSAFATRIATRLFPGYVDAGSVVSVPPDVVRAIDDAIFDARPSKRRTKRLDWSAWHCSGGVLAQRVTNLMSCPLEDLVPVTVELKPKCGLIERPGMPSRYRMLQYHKLKEGKISRISSYDPVDLLSGDTERVLRALQACIQEPQNNIRVFAGSAAVFSEECIVNAGVEPTRAALEAELAKAHLPSLDPFLQCLAGLLSSGTQLPQLLRRAQCWACGDTAQLAKQLYSALQQNTPAFALTTDYFELALESMDLSPSDAAGVTAAVSAMDAVLERICTEGWSAEAERETRFWICRFLLGRTAHDVSLLVNFVYIVPEALTVEHEARLTSLRYAPLQLAGIPLPWAGIWVRTSVVDTDMKKQTKISEYATELDTYALAYLGRATAGGGGKPAPALAHASTEAVGGHDNAILYEGSVVWKRQQDGGRGMAEADFLQKASNHSFLPRFVPAFHGVRQANGYDWTGMENAFAGVDSAAVIDLKMGTQTWDSMATPEKIASQKKKAQNSTTYSLGVRLVGGKFPSSSGGWERIGKINEIGSEAGLADVLARFLRTPELCQQAREHTESLFSWFTEQRDFAFYGSSLLMGYDGADPHPTHLRFKMIDFGHVEPCPPNGDESYLTGLATLRRILPAAP